MSEQDKDAKVVFSPSTLKRERIEINPKTGEVISEEKEKDENQEQGTADNS